MARENQEIVAEYLIPACMLAHRHFRRKLSKASLSHSLKLVEIVCSLYVLMAIVDGESRRRYKQE
jgi:hypothetical protein